MTAPRAPRHAPASQYLGRSVVRCTCPRLSVLEVSVYLGLGNRVRARLSHRFLRHGARFPARLSVVSHATYGVPTYGVLAWAVFPRPGYLALRGQGHSFSYSHRLQPAWQKGTLTARPRSQCPTPCGAACRQAAAAIWAVPWPGKRSKTSIVLAASSRSQSLMPSSSS